MKAIMSLTIFILALNGLSSALTNIEQHKRLDALEAAPTRTHTCELVDGKNRYTCRYIEIEEVR